MDIKSIIILAGFLALFVIGYFTGWYCDKDFRLFLRKTKLSPFKARIYLFRGSRVKEDKGHAVSCVNFQQLAFLNLALGIICFWSVLKSKSKLVFLGSGALMALMGAMFLFQLYINTMKYKERKSRSEKMDETGFEEYRSTAPVAPMPKSSQPTKRTAVVVKSEDTNTDKIDTLAGGRAYLKNKGILDDDVFSPFVSDVTNKFNSVRIREDFSKADDISSGKDMLKDMIERQLKEEPFASSNKFERSVNFYSKDEAGTESTIKDEIDKHKQEIDPENQFKTVNNYSPVRKDDK